MSKLPAIKSSKLVTLLKKLGFRKKRQKGSHAFFEHSDGRTTLVPLHKGEDIGRGLLRQILREIELSPKQFFDFLNKK